MFNLPKLKVYVQLLDKGCLPLVSPKGDWIDLRAAQDVSMTNPQVPNQYIKDGVKFRDVLFESTLVPLGVRMLLPHGCEADLKPRSGTFKNFKTIQANHVGTIDWTYNGPKDQWMVNLIPLGKCEIHGPRKAEEADYLNEKLTINDGVVCGDRIAQFRVRLSQFASFKDKMRWLFSSGIELVYVDNIDTVISRDGFSSTGVA